MLRRSINKQGCGVWATLITGIVKSRKKRIRGWYDVREESKPYLLPGNKVALPGLLMYNVEYNVFVWGK